ncbi:MAG: enolase C-terminal domain-like protein [Acidimicrobiales bacterium]
MTTPVAVRLHRVRYPLRTPHAAAHGVEVERDLILVEVEFADGVIGWGECSALARPTYTSEHTAGAWFVLRDELAPAAVEGRSFDVVGHPMALAAMRGAMLDASGRRRGQNLAGHFAARAGFPEPRAAVERCAVVGRRDVLDDLVAEVGELLEGRVDAVKLKVTPQPADLAAVAGVRTAWPDLRLAVDFNGTATSEAARAVARHGLAYIEQPAPAGDLLGSAQIAAEVDCPVALDESIATVEGLHLAERVGAGRIVNVKPARCGGLEEAIAMLVAARDLGWSAFVGGMVESGVGRAAALCVAAQALPSLPTDLGPSLAYVDVDLTDAIELDELGRVVVPDGPGIGRVPIADRLGAATVDRAEIPAP